MKILLIEDDWETASHVSQGLSGHVVAVANDGQAGLEKATSDSWDVLIVDRMLPKLDGLTLVRVLREKGYDCPILFLTTLDGIDDRVSGFDAGGDDYLVKPFAIAELNARIEALGRRRRSPQETMLNVADIRVDLIRHTVHRADRSIELFPQEFRLLAYLMCHTGQVVTRVMLLENVWGLHFDPGTNIVESHISRLRAKLSDDSEQQLISTVRGAGYVLNASS